MKIHFRYAPQRDRARWARRQRLAAADRVDGALGLGPRAPRADTADCRARGSRGGRLPAPERVRRIPRIRRSWSTGCPSACCPCSGQPVGAGGAVAAARSRTPPPPPRATAHAGQGGPGQHHLRAADRCRVARGTRRDHGPLRGHCPAKAVGLAQGWRLAPPARSRGREPHASVRRPRSRQGTAGVQSL